MHNAFATRVILLILASFVMPKIGIAAKNRFSQLSLVLKGERPYEWDFDKRNNAVIVFVKNTSADELAGLDRYDEDTIKRVVVKESGGRGSEIKLFLNDRNLRASIAHFSEPYRIVIDIFDRGFQEQKDPSSQLPMIPGTGSSNISRPAPDSTDAWDEPAMIEKAGAEPKHFLIQPENSASNSSSIVADSSIDSKSGVGTNWDKYPVYIYRLHAVLHSDDATQQAWMRKSSRNSDMSAESMAEYAGKLFDFGHEYKAVEGYQKVLKAKPAVLDRAPLHLWRMAEATLGTGSLALADEYFAKFVARFPQSKLQPIARLRRLDIKAIRAVRSQDMQVFSKLLGELDQIRGADHSDFSGLKAIRSAYWKNPASNMSTEIIPDIGKSEHDPLQGSMNGLESFRSMFLAKTLLINNRIQKNYPWEPETGIMASEYFKKFKEYGDKSYVSQIKDGLKKKLIDTFSDFASRSEFDKIVTSYEALPQSMQSIRKTPRVAWYLAESYRKLGRPDDAVGFYGSAANGADNLANKFKASLWQGLLASRLLSGAAGQKRRSLNKAVNSADSSLKALWQDADQTTRAKLAGMGQESLEALVTEPNRMKAPLQIVLDNWQSALPSANTTKNSERAMGTDRIKVLSAMAAKFKKYNDKENRKRTIDLIKMLRPSQMADDQRSKDLWVKEMAAIADDMRLENNLLEAGRLYVLLGTESENYEKRAESLYKGGLLLFRAGRRNEAIDAFRQASEDGENQFYANLAKERLNRISN